MRICSFDGCGRESLWSGLCRTHYAQKQRTGEMWVIGSRRFPKHFAVKGKLHPAYKNGSGRGYNYKTSLLAIKMKGEKCEGCGKKGKLVRHHIDGNVLNDKPENWQVLCCKCHSRIHSKFYNMLPQVKKRIQRERELRLYREKNPIVHLPDGYIKLEEVLKILNASRQQISQHKYTWFKGMKFKIRNTTYTIYPKDYILSIRDYAKSKNIRITIFKNYLKEHRSELGNIKLLAYNFSKYLPTAIGENETITESAVRRYLQIVKKGNGNR